MLLPLDVPITHMSISTAIWYRLHTAEHLLLLQVSRELQAKGWWFNREPWTFIPDSATGKILVPVTALAIRGTTKTVINRGATLYSLDDTSYVFTDSVDCVVVWEVNFEDLPDAIAKLCQVKENA